MLTIIFMDAIFFSVGDCKIVKGSVIFEIHWKTQWENLKTELL